MNPHQNPVMQTCSFIRKRKGSILFLWQLIRKKTLILSAILCYSNSSSKFLSTMWFSQIKAQHLIYIFLMKKYTNIHLKYVFLTTTCKCSYDSLAKMLENLFFFLMQLHRWANWALGSLCKLTQCLLDVKRPSRDKNPKNVRFQNLPHRKLWTIFLQKKKKLKNGHFWL